MENLSIDNLALISGGNWVDTSCDVVTAGSAVYAVGVLAHWWNPIGWVSATAEVLSLACLAYWGVQRIS